MPQTRQVFVSTALALGMLVVGGCASKPHTVRMEKALTLYKSGQYALAAQEASVIATKSDNPKNFDTSKLPRDGLITRLEQGMMLRTAGNLEGSNAAFERANAILELVDSAAKVKLTEEAAAALTNATASTYRGTQYDRILLSVYLAMNHLELGNYETARAYLRQAAERQRWAEQRFAKQISDEQKEADDLVADKGGNVSNLLSDDGFNSQMSQAQGPQPLDLRVYDDYRNPLSEYLAGVTFLTTGVDANDREFAYSGFRQARGLEPQNPYLEILETAADDVASTRGGAEPMVHVIYESGIGPWRDEVSFAFPAILLSDDLARIGTPAIALPVLRWGTAANPYALVVADGQSYETSALVDVDGLVKAEWDVEYPRIVSRAVAATVTKALAAFAANTAADRFADNSDATTGALLRVGTLIGTSVFQVATNAADTRAWMSLPKEVQIASLPVPADGRVTVQVGGYTSDFDLDPDAAGHLIFIRQPTASAPPAVRGVALRPGFDALPPADEPAVPSLGDEPVYDDAAMDRGMIEFDAVDANALPPARR